MLFCSSFSSSLSLSIVGKKITDTRNYTRIGVFANETRKTSNLLNQVTGTQIPLTYIYIQILWVQPRAVNKIGSERTI